MLLAACAARRVICPYFVGYTHRIASQEERAGAGRAANLARAALSAGPPDRAPAPGTAPRPERYVAGTKDRVWVTRAVLAARGWTDAAVRDFLPGPEGHMQNPHCSSAAPMPVWTAETVAEAEATGRWQAWLARSLQRRGIGSPDRLAEPAGERFGVKLARVQDAIATHLPDARRAGEDGG